MIRSEKEYREAVERLRKPRSAVVASAGRDGCLMEGVNGGAVIGSKRNVEDLACRS